MTNVQNNDDQSVSILRVVGYADKKMRAASQAKSLEKLDMADLPQHVTISCDLLEECMLSKPTKSTDDKEPNTKEKAAV